MTIERALVFSILMSAIIAAAGSAPAMAQACTREGANAMTAGGACCQATPSSGLTAHDRA